MLDVAIVSYRCRPLLRDCIESLLEHAPGAPMRLHVADNHSGDGTVEMLIEDFPDVDVVPLARNMGFAAANNVLLRRGVGTYVLVLNPDTRVAPRTLDAMLDLMESNSQIGIAGCRLVRDDGTLDHAARRSFPTASSALGHFLRFGRWNLAPDRFSAYRAPYVDRGPVDAVNGAFMFMRRKMLDEIGLFDEGFWMYMEDLDLCYRAAAAGWQTWYESRVSAVHLKGGTTGPYRTLRLNRAFHYGMYRYYRKHLARRRSSITNGIVYSGIAMKFAVATLRSAAARGIAAAQRRTRTACAGAGTGRPRVDT